MLLRRGLSEWQRRLLPLMARQAGSSSGSNCDEPQAHGSRVRQRNFFSEVRDSCKGFSCLDCNAVPSVWKPFDLGYGAANDLVLQQRYGIATSAYCSASEESAEEPVRSPLSQAPGPLGSGGQRLGVSATKTAQAVLTGIRQSPQKLNLVAEMVRGMRVEDALTQMAVSVKRAAKTVSKVVHSAQANAVHNFGLEKDRLVVSEAFVGKDKYLKRFMPHGKGKAGRLEHPRARLTVIVKEMSVEQETELARLRVFRRQGTRMSRTQERLVPHRVLETQWNRQRTPLPESAEPVVP